MSRQIQVYTTPKDDLHFVEYLHRNFDCALFQSFAPTEKSLWIESPDELYDRYDTIKIWNRDFPWKPVYNKTSRDQLVYISNTVHAPVIMLERTNWETHRHGKVYWAKEISDVPEYHTAYFEKFYNKVAQWFQKNAFCKVKQNDANVYYMRDAWKRIIDSKYD